VSCNHVKLPQCVAWTRRRLQYLVLPQASTVFFQGDPGRQRASLQYSAQQRCDKRLSADSYKALIATRVRYEGAASLLPSLLDQRTRGIDPVNALAASAG
jgi:hypothetical protein